MLLHGHQTYALALQFDQIAWQRYQPPITNLPIFLFCITLCYSKLIKHMYALVCVCEWWWFTNKNISSLLFTKPRVLDVEYIYRVPIVSIFEQYVYVVLRYKLWAETELKTKTDDSGWTSSDSPYVFGVEICRVRWVGFNVAMCWHHVVIYGANERAKTFFSRLQLDWDRWTDDWNV